jgi:formylglycine-generating enzyme required for sulfatase activity
MKDYPCYRLSLVLMLFSMIFCFGACSGGGSDSPPVMVIVIGPPLQVVADPIPGGDLKGTRVDVSWKAVDGAASYNVYYGTAPGVTKASANKETTQSQALTVKRLTNGTKYYFVVTAVNGTGESIVSKEVSATPSATPPPAAPKDVTAEPEVGKVLISWTAADGATSYQIYYGTAPNVTKATGTLVANAVSPQEIAGLLNGQTYYFVVTATNANGESATSFEVSAMPLDSPPPVRPTGVTVNEGDAQATLIWPAVPGATSYNVYYTTDKFVISKTYAKATKVSVNTPTVTVRDLTNKVAYFFVVTSVNGAGESANSATLSATPLRVKPVSAMIQIPGGTFQMGDSPNDGITYALPVHNVHISTFYIDNYPTTYDLWKSVYDWAITHGYTFDWAGKNGSNGYGTNMPVTTIDWYDVLKWFNARSEMNGRTPVYYTDNAHATVYRTGQVDLTNAMVDWSANGYRLPTEAEWEKAARGNLAGNRYPWGNDLTPDKANYDQGMTTSVGLYPPNGFGLYDMAGNVYQWVWDWGESSAGYADALLYTTADTHGPAMGAGKTRVRRGGGWAEGSQYLKCAERVFRVPTYAAPYFGFRSASNTP